MDKKQKLKKAREQWGEDDKEDMKAKVKAANNIIDTGQLDKTLKDLSLFDHPDAPPALKKKVKNLQKLLVNMKTAKDKAKAMDAVHHFVGEMVYPTKEFNKELDYNIKSARRMAEGKDGLHPMVFVILDYSAEERKKPKKERKRTQMALMIGMPEFDIGGDKRRVMLNIGRKIAQRRDLPMPLAAFMVSDAWASNASDDMAEFLKFDEKGNILPPSEQPARAEAIVIAGLTRDGRTNFSQNIYKRIKKEGKPDVIMFNDDFSMTSYYEVGKPSGSRAYLLEALFAGYGAEEQGKFPDDLIMMDMAEVELPRPN